ncbi:MAG: hypothetical protein KF689_11360 [Gemmatimonadaceae bacterium]|nr:hypothetical protein [Gemmatimonadaceae bacterium]MCW5825806.1 hypothetical protein [Gemmatimonadaceae bacterium]
MRLAIFPLACLCATAVDAQKSNVVVRDGSGASVAYAYVQPSVGTPITLDSTGHGELTFRGRDSVHIRVRRIGYTPLDRWVRLPAPDTLEFVMGRVVQTLGAVEVVGVRDTPLARRGFYDRMERVRRGATVGDFITPEQLELQLPMTLTQALRDARYASIGRLGDGRAVLLGRGGCPLNLVVDGQLVQGTSQDEVVEQVPTSIRRDGSYRPPSMGAGTRNPDINQFVSGNEISAIEIYPSVSNAPYELQAAVPSGRGTCGIVAVWTGGRK